MPPQLTAFCLFIGLGFAAVILLALVVKLIEVRRASRWHSTRGTVIKSRQRTRRREDIDNRPTFETEPLVTYEYEVAGRRYRSSRLSFAERIGGMDTGIYLERYPAGKDVQVYYNPADPRQAVLERDIPPVFIKVLALLVLAILSTALLIPQVIYTLAGWVSPLLPDPRRALAGVFFAGFGLGLLLFAFALQRQVRSAYSWSPAAGLVLSSQAEAYQTWAGRRGGSQLATYFRPSIVYTFQVEGRQVISNRVSFGWDVSWSSASFFRHRLERYPEDSSVTVYYNPLNPAECVLERRAAGLPFLLGGALALLVLAVIYAAGWI